MDTDTVVTRITQALTNQDWETLGQLWAPVMACVCDGEALDVDPQTMVDALTGRYGGDYTGDEDKISDELDTLLVATLGSGATDAQILNLPVGFFFPGLFDQGRRPRIGRLLSSQLRDRLSQRCHDELVLSFAFAPMRARAHPVMQLRQVGQLQRELGWTDDTQIRSELNSKLDTVLAGLT